ncbi:MAG: hypothetical protein ACRD2W_18865 [Acidimicrobiales bacterium]
MGIGDRLKAIIGRAKGAAPDLPTAVVIPADHVVGGAAPPELTSEERYFRVLLNQLWLAEEREWFTTWDPMALIVTEFRYRGERTSVPYIVGRGTLEKKLGHALPGSMLLDDTYVAGLYPYMGAPVEITVVLYKVQRDNYARALLGMVEKASSIFPFASSLDLYLDVADVVLDGVEAVLGIDGTEPVFGRYHSLHSSAPASIGSGYFALVDDDVDPADLWVSANQLHWRDEQGALQPFRGADFLLYSVGSSTERDDVDSLSFTLLVKEALAEAQDPSEDARKRAKAAMVSAFAAMIKSHDLIYSQSERLRDKYLARLASELDRGNALANLSEVEPEDPRRAAALYQATKILDL